MDNVQRNICAMRGIMILAFFCVVGTFLTYVFSTKYIFWMGNCMLGHCFSNLIKKCFEKLWEKKPRMLEMYEADDPSLMGTYAEVNLKEDHRS